jgi:hypothetical protein
LGNLNAGDYTLVSFQILPTRNFTQGTRKLLVEISYTDAVGIRRVVEKDVEVGLFLNTTFTRIRTPTQFQAPLSNGLLYIIIGIAGIVCVILFLKLRKWMKRKK